MRQGVSDFFRTQSNVSVVFATDNGNELLNFLDTSFPQPNVCILDISMPKMDGLTLLETIKKTKRKQPCLIYSMQTSMSTIAKAIALGANGYLTKNFGFEELHRSVIAIAEHGYAYTDDADQYLFDLVERHEIDVPTLSERERLFIKLAATELSYDDIAGQMRISTNSLKNYRVRCYKKLNVTTRSGLVLQAIRLGIITI